MFALFASLAFTAAAFVAVFAVSSTCRQNHSRIVDALRGHPLKRVKPLLFASA